MYFSTFAMKVVFFIFLFFISIRADCAELNDTLVDETNFTVGFQDVECNGDCSILISTIDGTYVVAAWNFTETLVPDNDFPNETVPGVLFNWKPIRPWEISKQSGSMGYTYTGFSLQFMMDDPYVYYRRLDEYALSDNTEWVASYNSNRSNHTVIVCSVDQCKTAFIPFPDC